MTVTRANAEMVLVKRCGPLMTAAGMATTVAGSNADLNDPIGWALRQLGYSVASITAVSDTDMASLADAYIDQFLDLAELRTLESVQGNLDDVDIQLGPRREDLSQLASQVEKRLARLTQRIEQEYGYGAATIEAGVITYEFAEHYTGTDDD